MYKVDLKIESSLERKMIININNLISSNTNIISVQASLFYICLYTLFHIFYMIFFSLSQMVN
jgi:hypothetical protein